MNRVIKFRAFDTGVGRFINTGFGVNTNMLDDGLQTNPIKIMQFTGKLDRKGKEIYEGDIVINGDFIEDAMAWNEWKREIKWDDENSMWLGLDGERIEVIGNIFEIK